MNDAEKFSLAKAGLKYCPECGNDLERHQMNVNLMSCFVHGDFRILWVDGALQVQWVANRMAAVYMSDRSLIALQEVDPAQSRVRENLAKAREETGRLEIVALTYAAQEIDFLHAAQLITNIETGEFPDEPTEAQRKRARLVLDHLVVDAKAPRNRD